MTLDEIHDKLIGLAEKVGEVKDRLEDAERKLASQDASVAMAKQASDTISHAITAATEALKLTRGGQNG